MNKIGILVDNTCGISKSKLNEMGIGYIPLYVVRNGKYIKASEISRTSYYDEIMDSTYAPKTSQPSVGDFQKAYNDLLEKYDKVITVTLSSKISGTYNSAKIAANFFPSDKIYVYDSLLSSYGLGFLVYDLKELLDKEKNVKKALEKAENLINNYYKKVHIYLSVGDLNYLRKSGRLNKGHVFLGKLLKLNPIIKMEEGQLIATNKVRGIKKTVKTLVKDALNFKGRWLRVAVLHSGNLEAAHMLIELLKEEGIKKDDIIFDYVDVVVGTHLGPKSVGVIVKYE